MLKRMVPIIVIVIVIIVLFIVNKNYRYSTEMCNKLNIAIETGDEELIEKYMNTKFDINAGYRIQDGYMPRYPLAYACKFGRFNLAKRMIKERGADVNASHAGPINILLRHGTILPSADEITDMYDFYIDHGYNLDDPPQLTPFSDPDLLSKYISYMGEEDIIRIIDHVLDNGGIYGQSKIIVAATKLNNLKILKHLIENRKIEISYEKYHDGHAILFALENKSYEAIEYLVSKGFRLDIKDDYGQYEGKTALEIAEEMGDERLIEILSSGEKDDKVDIKNFLTIFGEKLSHPDRKSLRGDFVKDGGAFVIFLGHGATGFKEIQETGNDTGYAKRFSAYLDFNEDLFNDQDKDHLSIERSSVFRTINLSGYKETDSIKVVDTDDFLDINFDELKSSGGWDLEHASFSAATDLGAFKIYEEIKRIVSHYNTSDFKVFKLGGGIYLYTNISYRSFRGNDLTLHGSGLLIVKENDEFRITAFIQN